MNRFFAAFLILFCAIGLMPSTLQAGDEGFFSGIEDFPLMSGLNEIPDATLIFDSPTGRFVEAYAQGHVTPDSLSGFYADTLPQLGWQPTSPTSFAREDEVLEIIIVGPAADDGTRTVRFAISPAEN